MNINEERLVEVDDDESELDSLFASFDKKAKALRWQVMGDVVKEFATSAKAERGKLLADAEAAISSKVESALTKASEKLHAEVTAKMQAEHNRLASRVEKTIRALHEAAKPTEAHLSPEVVADLRSCLQTMQEGLKAKETPIPSLPAPAAPSPRPVRFEVERDDFGKIKSVIPHYE